MNDNSSISNTVMRRVRVIHALRPLLSVGLLSVLTFVAAVWGISREVWVARVIENMSSVSDIAGLVRFFGAAFVGTDLMVQVLSVLAVAAAVWLTQEFARVIATLSPRMA